MADAITFALGNLSYNAVYVGFMATDAVDVYSFNHPAKGQLNCSVEGFSAGLELRLKTPRGRLIDCHKVQPYQLVEISFDLPAGCYVLEIVAIDGNTTYQLTLQQERELPETPTNSISKYSKLDFYKKINTFGKFTNYIYQHQWLNFASKINNLLWQPRLQKLKLLDAYVLSFLWPLPRGQPS